jgi:hypothetical protein
MTGHCDRASCQIALSDDCECICFGCTYAKLEEQRGVRIRKVRPEDLRPLPGMPPLGDTPDDDDPEGITDQVDQDPLADVPEILELPNENDFGDR